jgi:hypothetical protein
MRVSTRYASSGCYTASARARHEQTGETAEVINIMEHLDPIRRTEAVRILRVLAGDKGA